MGAYEKTQIAERMDHSSPLNISVSLNRPGKDTESREIKYLGEWVENNLSEKEALMSRISRTNMANKLAMNTQQQDLDKCKLKHY